MGWDRETGEFSLMTPPPAPPDPSPHGQSLHTLFKQQRFHPIFVQSLRISKATGVARYPYYHVDLNSGPGFNDQAQVEGSPLNFLRAVDTCQRHNFQAFFIDKEPRYIRTLLTRPEIQRYNGRQVTTHIGDNAEILPVVSAYILRRENRPECAVGSILIDPVGYQNGVPWQALYTFCRAHPWIDLIMNLNVRTFQCTHKNVFLGRDRKHRGEHLHPISSFPAWFDKPNWMITQVNSSGGNRWVQLVGRTITLRDTGYASIGFFDYRSPTGQDIIAQIEHVSETETPAPSLLDGITDDDL